MKIEPKDYLIELIPCSGEDVKRTGILERLINEELYRRNPNIKEELTEKILDVSLRRILFGE